MREHVRAMLTKHSYQKKWRQRNQMVVKSNKQAHNHVWRGQRMTE